MYTRNIHAQSTFSVVTKKYMHKKCAHIILQVVDKTYAYQYT